MTLARSALNQMVTAAEAAPAGDGQLKVAGAVPRGQWHGLSQQQLVMHMFCFAEDIELAFHEQALFCSIFCHTVSGIKGFQIWMLHCPETHVSELGVETPGKSFPCIHWRVRCEAVCGRGFLTGAAAVSRPCLLLRLVKTNGGYT